MCWRPSGYTNNENRMGEGGCNIGRNMPLSAPLLRRTAWTGEGLCGAEQSEICLLPGGLVLPHVCKLQECLSLTDPSLCPVCTSMSSQKHFTLGTFLEILFVGVHLLVFLGVSWYYLLECFRFIGDCWCLLEFAGACWCLLKFDGVYWSLLGSL